MGNTLKKLKGRAPSQGPWRQQVGLNTVRISGNSPAVFRFRVGQIEAAIVSDGPITLQEPHEVFTTLSRETIMLALEREGIAEGPMHVAQNCLLLDLGGHLVLIDNGMGSSTLFGSEAGRLIPRLAAAGIMPEQIDTLVLSHAHSDHCWGTMRDDGVPAFPNARIFMAEPEFHYWANCTEPGMEIDVRGFRKHILPLRDRILFFEDGEAFLPGLRAVFAPGHTPGHCIFLVSSDGDELCVLCDVTLHDPLSFSNAEAESVYDHDRQEGARTRMRLLGQLADEEMNLVSYHAPWPGLGRVVREGNAYRYVSGGM